MLGSLTISLSCFLVPLTYRRLILTCTICSGFSVLSLFSGCFCSCELKYRYFSVCRFPVESDLNGAVSIPRDECVQEWELPVAHPVFRYCLDVKAVDML